MPTTFNNAEEVWDFMEDQIETMDFRGEPQEFVPKLAFEQVTTREVVKLVVHENDDFLLSGQKLDDFIDQVHREAPIMFATCTYAKLSMNVLKALLDDDLTDASLPLTREACNNPKLKKQIRRFNDNLKRIRTAYFDLNSYHRTLEGYTKPIKLDERNVLGKGAFGDVYNIEIHPEHRSFSSGANKKGEFALKVTQQEGRELNFHKAMAGLAHAHLLKCLASFTFSSKYHMIYEKADYDVEGFMERHENAQKLDSFSGSDLAAQLHGLAAALLVIHNQENGDLDLDPSRLGIPQVKPARSGYIHDIKPDNLLLFIYEHDGSNKYWFRLSDFSCAKVVDFVHRVSGKRRSHLSDNKAGNPTYRAPEMWKKLGTSRPYDLWSLGCVYLELLVWYMDGFQTLTEFRDARFCQVHPGGTELAQWASHISGRATYLKLTIG